MSRVKNELASKQIRIVRCFDCIDLRKITSQSTFLQEELKKYHMHHLDAVLYTNQALTRFRMILNIHETAFLCCPEIDDQSKTSLYLRISEVLSKLSGVSHVNIAISKISDGIHDRIRKQDEKQLSKELNRVESSVKNSSPKPVRVHA